LEFSGRAAFEGERLTLRATTPPDATESDIRMELLEVLHLGLAPFAAATTRAPVVEVRAQETPDGSVAAPEEDPWNRWVFSVGVDGFMNGESQQRFINGSGHTSASRVTAEWKTLFSVRGSLNRSEYELPGGVVTSQRESYGAGALVARSVGEHWGVGVIGEWSRSTFNNYDASIAVGPAVEYDVFPYSESTRRLLTFTYAIGPRFNDYGEVTIFGAMSETLLQQLLVVSYDITQPWGDVDLELEGNHYLASIGEGTAWLDPQYSLRLGGGFRVRLIRGLSVGINGSVSMVRDQIQLSAAELTEEEILTQQRELATDYRYFLSLGLSYRFGSIFSTIVNPRFGVIQ
ncbi:MAG: hypothetical protein ACOC5I_02240, partial [Gemmatimonadota bacterium]